MPQPMIQLRQLNKSYGNGRHALQVLQDVDLSVEPGELLAIVGTSGSGKSTLLNVIGALDPQFSGQALVAGHDLAALNDRQLSQLRNEQVGFVFQQFNLLEHLTCAENVALPAVFSHGGSAPVEQRVHRALTRVGMADRMRDRPGSLSGGQKQRIAIARALLNDPPLLLCDEPTGNLDRTTGRQIIELFCELNAADGVTLVIVTHEARVSSAAHRVIELEDGRVVQREVVTP